MMNNKNVPYMRRRIVIHGMIRALIEAVQHVGVDGGCDMLVGCQHLVCTSISLPSILHNGYE